MFIVGVAFGHSIHLFPRISYATLPSQFRRNESVTLLYVDVVTRMQTLQDLDKGKRGHHLSDRGTMRPGSSVLAVLMSRTFRIIDAARL